MIHANSRIASWLVASILALGASGARAQGIVAQAVSNGAAGLLEGRDAAGAVTAWVTQSRSPTTGKTDTILFFEIDEPYSGFPWGTTNVLFGSGTIPDADLSVDGLARLALDTDTASNAGFVTYACPNPPNPEPPFCTQVPNRGRVQLTLSHSSATPVWQFTGTNTQRYGNLQFTWTGSGVYGAATGEGNVVGHAFPAGSTGILSTNHDVDVTIQQGQ